MRIDLGAYTEREDLDSMLFSLRQCRSIARQPALEAWGATEIFPGPEVGDSEEELVAYIRDTTTTYHHQVGTCAMGTGEEAVVDPESFVPRARTAGTAGGRCLDHAAGDHRRHLHSSVPARGDITPAMAPARCHLGERGAAPAPRGLTHAHGRASILVRYVAG